MKKTLLTVALALGMAFPLAEHSKVSSFRNTFHGNSEIWLIKRDNTQVFRMTRVFDRDNRGRIAGRIGEAVSCTLERGTEVYFLHRLSNGNPMIRTLGRSYCIGYIKAHDGVVRHLDQPVKKTEYEKPPTYVYTSGRWHHRVPVFKSRNAYFDARKSMDKYGHYGAQAGDVACTLLVGKFLKFTPYKDWGVGEVETGNCRGWIDRDVVR